MTHVFEKAGLGRAPFRVVGFELKTYQAVPGDPGCPIQPGASCDYCATAIVETFYITDAAGKRFHVGNECVKKTGDKGLVDEAKRTAAKIRREASHARDAERIERARALLEAPEIQAALAATPHPHAWAEKQGLSALEFVTWMLGRAGNAGRIRACRVIEAAEKAAQAAEPASR